MQISGVGGIWPATLTPFTADGRVDDEALAAHVRDVAGTPGVRAVVVNGHAGEATSLDSTERAQVVRVAAASAGGVPVVAGVVADDTRGACALARDAARSGASALLLFPPAVFAQGAGMRPDMARRFVSEVAGASELPIVLFQLSRASGLAFSTETLARLCEEVPAIVAVKEGSDIPELYEDNLRALRALPRPVTLLSSSNSWLFASLVYGADGVLSGLGSVAAPLLVALHEAVARGDLAAARAVNDRLVPLCRAFYRAPYLDAHNRMKTALHLLGRLPHPDPRPPLLPVPADETARIRAALAASGLLPSSNH
ncbi:MULTISPECIES: dihydrodipicolinate synthase family protein [unclassified Variovorax]|jgi:4-hydroxy-tetrahydrodipicolinate synthase|uniref:dihydrodipicolinate synthase family protein n=1 Tax=unclassified Variovorax TaxID=663243 RepID=UPI000F7D7123|nr:MULTISPECIES: dihydrodipicolinate synthase family protein [unclassified Variovorax]RSZ39593.1 dihydrodipicolinate synthase family protein [Variovorax sp. 553]RSZ40703.1 dihydrodipicolinate synthase family protein [Variovorax sp. 679]